MEHHAREVLIEKEMVVCDKNGQPPPNMITIVYVILFYITPLRPRTPSLSRIIIAVQHMAFPTEAPPRNSLIMLPDLPNHQLSSIRLQGLA